MKTKYDYNTKMRHAIRVLSLSPLYWRFHPSIRLEMVKYYIFEAMR